MHEHDIEHRCRRCENAMWRTFIAWLLAMIVVSFAAIFVPMFVFSSGTALAVSYVGGVLCAACLGIGTPRLFDRLRKKLLTRIHDATVTEGLPVARIRSRAPDKAGNDQAR